MTQYLARNRLIGAAEAIQDRFKLARKEAITRNMPVYLSFQTSAIYGADYPGVRLSHTSFPNDRASIDPVRATTQPGTLHLENQRGDKLKVIVSMLGRVRICAINTTAANPWYPPC